LVEVGVWGRAGKFQYLLLLVLVDKVHQVHQKTVATSLDFCYIELPSKLAAEVPGQANSVELVREFHLWIIWSVSVA
jgi:hypothetical protein